MFRGSEVLRGGIETTDLHVACKRPKKNFVCCITPVKIWIDVIVFQYLSDTNFEKGIRGNGCEKYRRFHYLISGGMKRLLSSPYSLTQLFRRTGFELLTFQQALFNKLYQYLVIYLQMKS